MARTQGVMLKVAITPEERRIARDIATSCGMTYAGWLAKVVRREIKEYQASPDSPLMSESIQGTSPSSLDFGR